MEYRIRVKMNGTRNNQPVSETHSVIGGSMWFIDDNLKTMSLVGGSVILFADTLSSSPVRDRSGCEL